MTERDMLREIVEHLSEERLLHLLVFARFLSTEEELEDWKDWGRRRFAEAYGSDEPIYTQVESNGLDES
jgi:hypothetical protein